MHDDGNAAGFEFHKESGNVWEFCSAWRVVSGHPVLN